MLLNFFYLYVLVSAGTGVNFIPRSYYRAVFSIWDENNVDNTLTF